MDEVHRKLEIMARRFLQDKDWNVSPFTYNHTELHYNSTTTGEVEGMFDLKQPIAGRIKTFSANEVPLKNSEIAVYRSMMGYSWATKAAFDEAIFLSGVIAQINEGLVELTYELGNLNNYSIELGFDNKSYFEESDMYAAYEFRVTARKK